LFNLLAYDMFLTMFNGWDTIIVGAGVGGLTAAAKLVEAGLRVLVLERNLHPGGTAYVYKRKGFTFPMGPLGLSTPELVRTTLSDLGEGDDFELLRIHYQVRAFNLEIFLSLPFPRMREELTRLFPSDTQALEQFFQTIKEIISALQLPDVDTNRFILENATKISASKYLHGLVNDWRLRRILGSLGTREPYSSLPLLAAMWSLMSKEGIWYPKGGMRSLCERLVKAVTGRHRNRKIYDEPMKGRENYGGLGEIRLGTEVTKIRVEKGKVLGVTLKDNTQIDSASIISNADYKTTFLKLMNPQEVPDEWYRAMFNAKQTESILQVCLGVDAKRTDLSSFKDANRLIYKRSQRDIQEMEEPNWNKAEIDPEALASQELEISLWGKDDRMLTPEGGAVMVIRTEANHSHFARYRPVWRERLPSYHDYKIRLGRALLQETAKLIPGLEKSVLVMDIATPLTFEEQGGRSEGAVAGWSWDFEECHDYQPLELVRTPIKGLFMAGYQAFSAIFMGGIPTAMESANRAAEAILQNVGPIEEIRIPGVK
jgi:phytoene dehydrogenase-like protein